MLNGRLRRLRSRRLPNPGTITRDRRTRVRVTDTICSFFSPAATPVVVLRKVFPCSHRAIYTRRLNSITRPANAAATGENAIIRSSRRCTRVFPPRSDRLFRRVYRKRTMTPNVVHVVHVDSFAAGEKRKICFRKQNDEPTSSKWVGSNVTIVFGARVAFAKS